jgi:tRNA-Thr(GGU) m(6)t(6)A37 methyltransferase TsaA
MDDVVFQPIGVIRTPFQELEGMPVQPIGALGVKGTVEVNPGLEAGLKDLDGFSHVILIYSFHLSTESPLQVLPFLDCSMHGVFATRVPGRPNGIGISAVRLTGIEGNTLYVEDVDMIDGTPLLDIKPFVPHFDNREVQRFGWFEACAAKATAVRSDSRFAKQCRDDDEPRSCLGS